MKRWLRKRLGKKRGGGEIYPDEIFLDASNLPAFDRNQFEGRIEQPIGKRTFILFGVALVLLSLAFVSRAWNLQVTEGKTYAQMSENNHLRETVLFPARGVISDRNGVELAWNEPNPGEPYSLRRYSDMSGISHAVGYAKEPAKDTEGHFYQDHFIGETGVEEAFDATLGGTNGASISETDARGTVISESVVEPAKDGENLSLSIDAKLSHELYREIASLAEKAGFVGGAAVIMDVQTGELLSLVSYPEYDQNILSSGTNASVISGYLTDSKNPFLNRATSGLYAPGSTVKPYVAVAALEEGVITPQKQILSTGSISIPNPFLPGEQSVFKDWRAQGWVDMFHALAVSSDVYFYEVGGGYKDQPGIGIDNIKKYARLFGFGEKTGLPGFPEAVGVIPDPAWKAAHFEDGTWRIGDTYHTAIGQYGFQVTPLQEVRSMGAIANDGTLLTPSLQIGIVGKRTSVPVAASSLRIARQGMRLGVTGGILTGLNVPYVAVAAKSGTAEIGTTKKAYVNSWITGFFPYEHPRYAFAIVMERGPVANTTGALFVMRQALDWMHVYAPQYFTPAGEPAVPEDASNG